MIFRDRLDCFRLIIHYELDNIDLLEDLHRSTTRFLKSRATKYKLESIILKYLKQLYATISKKEIKKILQEARQNLFELEQDIFEKNAAGLEELTLWLDSRLKEISIEQMMKNRLSKKMGLH